MKELNYINLFSNCIPVKGFRRSALIDLQRIDVQFVPNDLVDVINRNKDKNISEIIKNFDKNDKETFFEYVKFLTDNEYAFFQESDEVNFFPPMNLVWDFPGLISNATIIISNQVEYLKTTIKHLDLLGCEAVNVIFVSPVNITNLKSIISEFKTSAVRSIHLSIDFHDSMNRNSIIDMVVSELRISIIDIYDFVDTINFENKFAQIRTYKSKLNYADCGYVNLKDFCVNLPFFTESQATTPA